MRTLISSAVWRVNSRALWTTSCSNCQWISFICFWLLFFLTNILFLQSQVPWSWFKRNWETLKSALVKRDSIWRIRDISKIPKIQLTLIKNSLEPHGFLPLPIFISASIFLFCFYFILFLNQVRSVSTCSSIHTIQKLLLRNSRAASVPKFTSLTGKIPFLKNLWEHKVSYWNF